ncbi:hypothetical protein WAI453_004059 [Rhynchosporium graminicola]
MHNITHFIQTTLVLVMAKLDGLQMSTLAPAHLFVHILTSPPVRMHHINDQDLTILTTISWVRNGNTRRTT